MSSVKNRVRLFEKPKEANNIANKTYSPPRTNKFNKNAPNKLNIVTGTYIPIINNKVNVNYSSGNSNNINKSQFNAKDTTTTTTTTATTTATPTPTAAATTNDDTTKPTKPTTISSVNTDTNSDIDISNIKNSTSSNNSGRERNSSSNKSDNFKSISLIATTSTKSKSRPTSIRKGRSKGMSLDLSLENDLKKLLSTTDINKINSKDLVKAATVVQAPPTPKTASVAMVLLASKISALENELETVGKEMAENIKREVDLEFELDNVIIKKEEEIQAVTKPLVIRISQLEADLSQYKKSYSASSLDNITSSTRSSREHSDFFSEVNSPNSASSSINTTHSSMFYDKPLKDNINPSNENYHDELEKMKKEFSEQFKKKEESIKIELKERFEIEKKELLRNYYNEKESVDLEIENLIKIKNKLDKEIISIKDNFEDEKKLLKQEYENEISKLKENFNSESTLSLSSLTLLNELREEQQKLKDHLNDKEKIETEFHQLKFEFDQIQYEKDKIEIKFKNLNNKIDELEQLNENLESKLITKDERIKELKFEFEFKKEKEIKNLKIRFKVDYENIIQALRGEVETLRKRNKDLNEIESSYNELKIKNQEFQAKNTKISTELFELSKELERIEGERQLLGRDIEDLNEEKSQLINEKEELIKVIQNSEEEKLALKGDLIEVQGAHDKVADVLKFMKVEWETQYKKSNETKSMKINELNERIKNLEKQIELQGKMLDEHQNEAQALPKNESLYKNTYIYKQELEVLQQQLETSNKKISEKDEEQHNLIQTLEKTVIDCEAKFDALTKDHQRTLNSLQKKHEDEIKNITIEMQKKLELMEKKQIKISSRNEDEYDRLNEKLAQIQMDYLDAIHNKDQVMGEKHRAERKIKSLEMKLEDVLSKNMELTIELSLK